MTWLVIGVLIWIAVAIPVALLIGRSIRLAETRREQEHQAGLEANFVATDAPVTEEPWTGPATVPFAPSRLPWGGDRTASRPRPPVIRHPVQPTERELGARDSDVT